ncbi:MAG: NADH-quinone oxidoreductase subunit C [Candidatus Omnitrophota bacterium]
MNPRDRIKEELGKKISYWQEVNSKRIYFTIDKKDIFKTTEFMFGKLGLRFVIASGLETVTGFEILYHFSYDKTGEIYSARVLIEDKNNPEIDSITPIFPGAEWIEREMWELLGINFKGHPNLKRLLLSEDWPEGEYPLRHKNEP